MAVMVASEVLVAVSTRSTVMSWLRCWLSLMLTCSRWGRAKSLTWEAALDYHSAWAREGRQLWRRRRLPIPMGAAVAQP
jgi:hypothetical protein